MYAKIVVLLTMVYGLSLGQIPNGSFESWTNGQPDNWTQVLYDFSKPSITQSLSAEDSVASLCGTVIYDSSMQMVYAPLITAGSIGSGFSVSQRYAALQGYYQFVPVGGDEIYINVVLKKAASLTSLAVSNLAITNQATSWTAFSIPISYLNQTDIPDIYLITIQIKSPTSHQDAHPGSTMLIDNLSFSTSAGILPRRLSSNLTQRTNKDVSSINFHYLGNGAYNSTSKVFNLLGKNMAFDRTRIGSGMILIKNGSN